jgi:hypothetical protein
MNISTAVVQFNLVKSIYSKLNATGKSDISVTGVLENFMDLFLEIRN